jgi:peroxiredoxin Q/BCP
MIARFRHFVPALAILLSVGCVAIEPGKGSKAPSFTATLDSGQQATLESLMGPKGVVLYFYPKDETPGCTTQACTFQKRLAEFKDLGFNVVGVSVDTGESHKKFRSLYNLTFDLIADTDKALAKLYNVPTEADPFGTVGFRRTTFVISRDGVILNRFEKPDPEGQVSSAAALVRQPF